MLPKHNHIRSKAIRDAARGEDCTLCSENHGNTVFAHLNESWAGKGRGIKADDLGGGFFACFNCHQKYDIPDRNCSDIEDWEIMRAMYRTWRRLWDRGIIGEIK